MEQSCNSATGRQELWIGGTLKRPDQAGGQISVDNLMPPCWEKNRSSNNQGAFCYLRPDPDPVLNNVFNLLQRFNKHVFYIRALLDYLIFVFLQGNITPPYMQIIQTRPILQWSTTSKGLKSLVSWWSIPLKETNFLQFTFHQEIITTFNGHVHCTVQRMGMANCVDLILEHKNMCILTLQLLFFM